VGQRKIINRHARNNGNSKKKEGRTNMQKEVTKPMAHIREGLEFSRSNTMLNTTMVEIGDMKYHA